MPGGQYGGSISLELLKTDALCASEINKRTLYGLMGRSVPSCIMRPRLCLGQCMFVVSGASVLREKVAELLAESGIMLGLQSSVSEAILHAHSIFFIVAWR